MDKLIKRLLGTILALAVLASVPCAAWMNSAVVGQGASAPAGKTYLLQETLDVGPPSDGTNISGYNSWIGDSSDNIEIDDSDTLAPHGGTFHMRRQGSDTVQTTKPFTNQTSGKFVVDYWFAVSGTGEVVLFIASNGAFTWHTSVLTVLRTYGGAVQYYSGSWNTISGVSASTSTYQHLEVEFDLDADTFKVWVDGTAGNGGSGISFYHTELNCDRIIFDDATDTYIGFVDDLEIYIGARQ